MVEVVAGVALAGVATAAAAVEAVVVLEEPLQTARLFVPAPSRCRHRDRDHVHVHVRGLTRAHDPYQDPHRRPPLPRLVAPR